MVIRRDNFRAQTDFFSPMTGNTGTQIRYADAPVRRQETYGSRVKERLSDIGKGTRRAAPIMEAIKVAVQKTEDPFTRIQEKKSYAPEEENDMLGALEGAAGAAQDAIGAGVAQAETAVEEFRKGSNQRAAERRAERQLELKEARDERAALRGDMKKLFERDKRMYGNTVPKGSMGSGSKPGPAVDTRMRHSVGGPEAQPTISKFQKPETAPVKTRTYGGQGSSVNKLGATTIRQGGAVKDGKYVGKQERGPAVNVSGSAEANREKQRNLRMAQAQQSRLTAAVKATNTPTGLGLKAGSFGISQAGKDQAAINRGIAAAKKTGIPSQTAVQGGAMSQAARDQAAINRGIKAAEATGIPSGADLKPGSFGISSIQRDTPKQVTVKDAPKSTTTTFGGMIDTKSFLNKMKAKTDSVSSQDAPKQTVASLPSNYKQTEAKAFAQAKSFQDSKAKGKAAEKATGIQTKHKAGSFGISEAGRK